MSNAMGVTSIHSTLLDAEIRATTATETERRKIEKTTEGLATRYFNLLYNKVLSQNKDNAMIICDYIQSMIQELNLSDGYRGDVILLLGNFSLSNSSNKNNSNSNNNKNDNKDNKDNKKSFSFKDVTREDVLSFLNSLRKPETLDPLHKWIGTYNHYRTHLMRFFRWQISIHQKIDPNPDQSKIFHNSREKKNQSTSLQTSGLMRMTHFS